MSPRPWEQITPQAMPLRPRRPLILWALKTRLRIQGGFRFALPFWIPWALPFHPAAFCKKPELFALFLKGRYGWDLTFEDVQKMGMDVLETEREFNRRAGVSEEFFDVPEFMREEPLPPRNSVYDISDGGDAADLERQGPRRYFLRA